MIPSDKFYKTLTQIEGLKLHAYLDSASIPTIGIGTIRYPDGQPVKMGDVCTEVQANEWARYEAGKMAVKLDALVTDIPQQQFDALLLLMYNIGPSLSASTVLKVIKAKGTEDDIRKAWLMWNKAKVGGKLQPVQGLTNRRNIELKIFFS